MPLIFLCEDNGIGISTRTPTGWIEAQFRHRAGLHYIKCDGTDLVSAYAGAAEAADYARRYRKHVFLHRSEEHTSELQSLMRISYAVLCLKKKKTYNSETSIQYLEINNTVTL